MNDCETERMNVASLVLRLLGTSGQTSCRARGEEGDLGHAEKRGGWHLWRERERARGAPIICTVKRELEVSPVRLSGER